MNEEIKPPTIHGVETENDKGRCAPAACYAGIATDLCIIEQKISSLRQTMNMSTDPVLQDVWSDLSTAESYVNFARHKCQA